MYGTKACVPGTYPCCRLGRGWRTDWRHLSNGRRVSGMMTPAELTKDLRPKVSTGDHFQGPGVQRCLPESRATLFPPPGIHPLPYREQQDTPVSPTPPALGVHFFREICSCQPPQLSEASTTANLILTHLPPFWNRKPQWRCCCKRT